MSVVDSEDSSTRAYAGLDPHQVLAAVEDLGYRCDGHLMALNSYENRVYQVGIEDHGFVVAKFYRPGRWTDAAIQEEHDFCFALVAADIPAVAPLRDDAGASLHHCRGFRLALYPRCGGRAPDLEDPVLLEQMGRLIARIHNIGALESFADRPTLTPEVFGDAAYRYLLENGFIPADLEAAYETLAADLLNGVRHCYARAGDCRNLRLHGDCHAGNILWTDGGPFVVDFDDARLGPAVQDLWMLLPGDRPDLTARLADLLEGYTQFRDFDARELHLIEALRSLRIMHYAAWLARRWQDPAFPRAFPWFNSQRYWEEHILALREQLALVHDEPVIWH